MSGGGVNILSYFSAAKASSPLEDHIRACRRNFPPLHQNKVALLVLAASEADRFSACRSLFWFPASLPSDTLGATHLQWKVIRAECINLVFIYYPWIKRGPSCCHSHIGTSSAPRAWQWQRLLLDPETRPWLPSCWFLGETDLEVTPDSWVTPHRSTLILCHKVPNLFNVRHYFQGPTFKVRRIKYNKIIW